MPTLFYNGVTFDQVLTMVCNRTSVYDGPQYLYTRHLMHFRATLNPQAMSFAEDTHGNVIAVPGHVAPFTDDAIRHALSQPRGPFLYDEGGNTIVFVPAGADPGDVNNGPKPIVYNISQQFGQKTWLIEWSIEICLNECLGVDNDSDNAPPSALLSNQWNMHYSYDTDFYVTRIIRGRAIFRSDRLATLGAVPDDFRGWLFFPIPPTFRRSKIDVIQTENPNVYLYTVIDKQVPIVLRREGITRLEAWQTHDYILPNDAEAVIGAGFGIAKAGRDFAKFLATGGLFGIDALDFAEAMWRGATTIGHAVAPRMKSTLNIRCYGNRRSVNRRAMMGICNDIALNRFASIIPFGFLAIPTITARCTHDLMGKFVEFQYSLQYGVIGGIATVALGVGVFFADLTPTFPNNDDINGPAGLIASSTLNTDFGEPNLEGQARDSTFISQCIAAQLLGECQIPPENRNPPNRVNRTPP